VSTAGKTGRVPAPPGRSPINENKNMGRKEEKLKKRKGKRGVCPRYIKERVPNRPKRHHSMGGKPKIVGSSTCGRAMLVHCGKKKVDVFKEDREVVQEKP